MQEKFPRLGILMSEFPNFAAWLQRQMDASNLNQTELAKELGFPGTSSISRWLNFGARPEPLVCELLADRFGIDVVAVLRMAGHLRPDPSASPMPRGTSLPPQLLEDLESLPPQELAVVGTLVHSLALKGPLPQERRQ